MECKFENAWVGRCKNIAILNQEYCAEHFGLQCCSCGAQATHSCDETFSLVCGAPLCDDCEHEIAEDGTNGATMKHCKKSEQKYLPWYARDLGNSTDEKGR